MAKSSSETVLFKEHNVHENVSMDVGALSACEGERREFKKLQLLLLQRKRHFKIVLRSRLSVL